MSLISLELSDAGILAAGHRPPKLLAVDGADAESPGFALPQKEGLIVGQSAVKQARLYPQDIQHRFWDQLSTDPLPASLRSVGTHAEIAFSHLAQVWEKIERHGNEVLIAVPAFYSRHQLGLLLGMTQELSIPMKGLIVQAVAAAPSPFPGSRLLYLDVHLHKTEVTLLEQERELRFEKTITLDELGLVQLYRIWADTITEEFVRTARFDPLHDAASEQALYDRIPEVVGRLQRNPTTTMELRTESTVHRVTLSRDLLVKQSVDYLDKVRDLLRSAMAPSGRSDGKITLLMSHRFSRLPGAATLTTDIDHSQLVELEIGAGALNLQRTREQFDYPVTGSGVPFFTSRSWQPAKTTESLQSMAMTPESCVPTHLLHRHRGYPLSVEPLFIGKGNGPAGARIRISRVSSKTKQNQCSVRRRGGEVVLRVIGRGQVYIDDQPLNADSAVLTLGQTFGLGIPGETIQLIACLDADET